MKTLIRANPQAFTSWLLTNAEFMREHREELKGENQEVDALLEVRINGKLMLLHIEFQTYNDRTMPQRLLLYNVTARVKYKLPVLSFVLYLLKDGNIVPSGKSMLRLRSDKDVNT